MTIKHVLVNFAVLCAMTGLVQAAEAPPREALDKMFVTREAEWAAQECTHTIVETDLLWDDFIGTDTKGGTYSKQQSIEKSKVHSTSAHDCRLLQTQVHFYSDDVAVVFGSETAVVSKPGGGEERRCLYWTDTWLRRGEQWRIAAVQDARLPCPKGVQSAKCGQSYCDSTSPKPSLDGGRKMALMWAQMSQGVSASARNFPRL